MIPTGNGCAQRFTHTLRGVKRTAVCPRAWLRPSENNHVEKSRLTGLQTRIFRSQNRREAKSLPPETKILNSFRHQIQHALVTDMLANATQVGAHNGSSVFSNSLKPASISRVTSTRSLDERIPMQRPVRSTTGRAATLFSAINCNASWTESFASIVTRSQLMTSFARRS